MSSPWSELVDQEMESNSLDCLYMLKRHRTLLNYQKINIKNHAEYSHCTRYVFTFTNLFTF